MASSGRFGRQPQGPTTRVNHQINARQVRVIDPDNEQVGILDIEEAMRHAEDMGLDLVEVAPNADPPVCRIMDYGQFKYQQSKRQHEAKKHQKVIHLKEIKLRPKTEEHDFRFKLKHAIQFVESGDKVKVTIMFRGREMSHQELGHRLMEKFVSQIEDLATIESPPKMEGRTLSLILAPKKTKGVQKSVQSKPEKSAAKPVPAGDTAENAETTKTVDTTETAEDAETPETAETTETVDPAETPETAETTETVDPAETPVSEANES